MPDCPQEHMASFASNLFHHVAEAFAYPVRVGLRSEAEDYAEFSVTVGTHLPRVDQWHVYFMVLKEALHEMDVSEQASYWADQIRRRSIEQRPFAHLEEDPDA